MQRLSLWKDSTIKKITVTLDDDVANFLKEQSRLHNKPFGQVMNEMLRRGMTSSSKSPEPPPFKIVPNRSKLVPGIDPQKLNQLNDQLEAEERASSERS